MKNILKAASASILVAGLFAGTVKAAPILDSNSIGRVTASEQNIQLAQFIFGGHNYCWYDSAWSGPGWYWCGYAGRRGLGFGGGEGFHGWGRGGGHGGHGGGMHGGGHGGHMSAGHMGSRHMGGGHMGGGGHGGGGHGGGGHGGGGHGGGHK
jgi:hypothetical protein